MRKRLRFHIAWSCISLALITMYGISALSYVNAIFLSTYPASYLAYFYLGLAVLFIVTSQLTGAYLTHHYKRGMTVLLLFCIVIIMSDWQLKLHTDLEVYTWWPFVFCVFLMMSSKFLAHNYWNGISQLLEIREFKSNSNLLGGAVAAGGVVMGLLGPSIVNTATVIGLLPIMSGLLLLNVILLQVVTVDEALTAEAPARHFHYQYKLQKLLVPFILITFVFSTLVDYTFKYQMGLSFKTAEIAAYTSKLAALSNAIVFILQLFYVKMILRRFGLLNFILQVPLLLIMATFFVVFHSNLTTISLLLVTYNVINFSILDLSFQLLGNALPTQIRGITKLHLRGITLFGGSLISAVLIFFLSNKATPETIGLFLIFFAFVFVIVTKWIVKAYAETLENDLEHHHIVHLEDFYLTENVKQWYEVIRKCFASKEDTVKLIGYELLAQKRYPISVSILNKARKDLRDGHASVRIEAVKLLSQHMNKKFFKSLRVQLEVESDNEIVWWIFQAFTNWHKDDVLKIAQKYLNSDEELLQAGSISALIKFGSITDVLLALSRLVVMIDSSDPKARLTAVRILSLFDLHGAVESLSGLMMDSNVQVSIAAIQAAFTHPQEEYIPSLIQQMGVKNVNYYATKALLYFGENIVPVLFKHINENDNPVFHRAAIRCIATIKGKTADRALIQLISHDNSHIRNNTVKAIAYRAMEMEFTREFLSAIRKRIQIEKDHILYYRQLLQLKLTAFESQELKALMYGAVYRVLYLFVINEPEKLMPIISLILRAVIRNDFSGVFQQGVELLDSHLHNSEDRSFLVELFESSPKVVLDPEELLSRKMLGPWLARIFSIKFLPHEEKTMHDLEKLVVLRGCELFKALSADLLLVLANRLEVVLIARDTVLFQEGDIPGDVYVVAEGEINITNKGTLINVKRKFDFVGELSLLDDKPRTATATATTDVVMLKMSKIEYDRILDDFPDILRTIAQTLLGYLRNIQELTC